MRGHVYGWVSLRLGKFKVGCAIGSGLSERLCERIGVMLCLRLGEKFNQKMLQAFRQASTMIQESLNLSQVPSPDGCLVYF